MSYSLIGPLVLAYDGFSSKKLPGLAEICLPSEFHVGDIVQWKQNAIEIYWEFFVRYQYHEREWARCMACGDNVFGYVGPTTTENKEFADESRIKYDDWIPLQHHMSFMKGNVTEVSNSCCGVKYAWETHLSKSALKMAH
ncbi:unnamed protein product [Cylicocyclus nassatus]|uniref:Uncharacterized protein n=1 Tax=Cylicocyclus nassatus TaxID=53992 RepID=A0AA36DSA0_CYLNA|nr:unnamed protein product [Cylicocyclus nassatus]